jgi:hypothetical protein
VIGSGNSGKGSGSDYGNESGSGKGSESGSSKRSTMNFELHWLYEENILSDR